MLTIRSEVVVDGISGRQITDFLLTCTDERYQRWWPGVHLHLHTTTPGRGDGDHVGDRVFMDEYLGSRRVRMTAVVVEAVPGERVVWRFRKGVRLPARLTLELTDRPEGVLVVHTITAGCQGLGRVLDPLLRRYFSPAFIAALDRHVRTEFPLLRDLLHEAGPIRS